MSRPLRKHKPNTPPKFGKGERWCFVGVHYPDREGAQPLAIEGKIVVFDDPSTAGWFIPHLGGHRSVSWDFDMETFWFTPLVLDGFNKVQVITKYDPYNVPTGWPVRSESHGLDWHSHVLGIPILNQLKAYGLQNARSLYSELRDLEAA